MSLRVLDYLSEVGERERERERERPVKSTCLFPNSGQFYVYYVYLMSYRICINTGDWIGTVLLGYLDWVVHLYLPSSVAFGDRLLGF